MGVNPKYWLAVKFCGIFVRYGLEKTGMTFPNPPFGLSSVRPELTAEGRVEDWARIFISLF